MISWSYLIPCSRISIEEARNQQAQERHIIVMPDFGPNAGKEWMACESLVNTFPGANVGMLAFSTLDNHDASALQQLSLKSRNKLMRLTPMDYEVMERYLGECHDQSVLSEILPSLQDSQWYELASNILGLDTEDTIKQSVSDYDEVMSDIPDPGDELEVIVAPTDEAGDEISATKSSPPLDKLGCSVTTNLIANISRSHYSFRRGTAACRSGHITPSIWEATQAVAQPWLDDLMSWMEQLLERLRR